MTSVHQTAGPTRRHIRILGTRGIPAGHGGFESFAEELAPYLVDAGWRVTVYCQAPANARWEETVWRGVRLVHLPIALRGALGTMRFDWQSTRHALRESGIALVLGYNTAVISSLFRIRGVPLVMNMDGLEWKRGKWGFGARLWLYCNEWIGCMTSDHLFADHPEIARHLRRRGAHQKVSTVAYGARTVGEADESLLAQFGLRRDGYVLVIARPEPENSIVQIVRAFSSSARGVPLVVLGAYSRQHHYQREVLEAAGADVKFAGAIYDRPVVDALRRFARLYVHGHTIGGTNPSLVEALGAGVPTLAHDNRFNRWVCGRAAEYFRDEKDCAEKLDSILDDAAAGHRAVLAGRARDRHAEEFSLTDSLRRYERVLSACWERMMEPRRRSIVVPVLDPPMSGRS